MNEVACLMDWDLQAIVRGCSGETEAPHPNFPHFCSEQHRDDLLCSTFPEFSETTWVLHDELAELYKPFYPVLHPLSPQSITASTGPLPIPQEVKPSPQDSQDSQESKCKRSKKNQSKKVVKQVRAEGLCDTWAWRKYGQKPIKGSPYPRSYYKCSTSKGCLARKQVERCRLNPEVFIVTYTAEHSHHHHPPRRTSSLSGIARKNKYLNVIAVPKITQNCSPRTPLEDSIEDGAVPSGQSQDLILKQQRHVIESSTGEATTSDVVASDDWFQSLEELNGLGEEFALDGCFMEDFAQHLSDQSLQRR